MNQLYVPGAPPGGSSADSADRPTA